jgi:DNA-binding XRE family transcriptional regulator
MVFASQSSDPRIGVPAPYRVYDHKNFLAGFVADIKSAKRHIIIQSAFISIQRAETLAEFLRQAIRRDVCLCIFLQQPRRWGQASETLTAEALAQLKQFEAAVDVFREMGAHVTLRPKIHEKLAAFDDSVLWDGSMNILSHFDTSERMTRWESAAETLATIAEQGLHACEQCAAKSPLAISSNSSLSDWLENVGLIIRDHRRKARLTQRQLAERIGVSHTLIGLIERGRRQSSLETMRSLCLALGMDLIVGPRKTP